MFAEFALLAQMNAVVVTLTMSIALDALGS